MTMTHYVRKQLTTDDLNEIRIRLATRAVKLSDNPSCDFCGDEHPVWVYAATRMSTGDHIDNWRWSACEDCAAAIEGHDWAKIEDKIIKWLVLRFKDAPKDVLRTVAQQALKDFHQYAKPSRPNLKN